MDFISEYFYVIILIVGAIAQWLKSRSESEQEEEYRGEEPDYNPEELEEFIGEAERRNPRPAVPPPLPAGGALPGVGRSQVPDLRRNEPPPLQEAAEEFDFSAELDRQQALIDQAREFKHEKSARKSIEVKPAVVRPVSKEMATGIRERLHRRTELRSAFVLKEILEKPVGPALMGMGAAV